MSKNEQSEAVITIHKYLFQQVAAREAKGYNDEAVRGWSNGLKFGLVEELIFTLTPDQLRSFIGQYERATV